MPSRLHDLLALGAVARRLITPRRLLICAVITAYIVVVEGLALYFPMY